MKAVLDTNVLVSALLFHGPPSRFVGLWRDGSVRLLASAAMVREYSRVLAYPKFALSEETITALLHRHVLPFVTPVEAGPVPDIIKEDPADNHFLACAAAGKADVLVSGDRHLLNLKSYRGIPILAPAVCLEKFRTNP
ncbi:MAG: putative toxin-antitoxin system toxin component, PIN family [Elusimicrobiota bacterium]